MATKVCEVCGSYAGRPHRNSCPFRIKLKRSRRPGVWKSADGKWLFMRWEYVRLWHVYYADDNVNDGDPATFDGFRTLREAVEWAEGHEG